MVLESIGGVFSEYEDMVEDEGINGIIPVVGTIGIGVALADMLQDSIAVWLGMSPDPSDPKGLANSVMVKLAIGLTFGIIAIRFDGPLGLVSAVISIGAFVSQGAEAIEVLVRTLQGL